jgi:hypothetical protein
VASPSCIANQIGAFDAQNVNVTLPLPPVVCATVNERVVLALETPVPVPVIVSVYVPAVVVAAVAIVSVDVVAVTLVGLSVAVTPVGAPVTATLTAPVNPPARVTVIVDVLDAPCVIEPVTAEAASVKEPVSCGAVTTRLNVVLALVTPIPDPLIVIKYAPAAVVAAVASVSVDVVPVALLGFSVAVTPVGAPDTVSATAPENVPVRVTLIVDVTVAPAATDAGDALNANPDAGAAVTLSAIVAVFEPTYAVAFTIALSETAVLLARTVKFVVVTAAPAATLIDSALDVTPLPRLAGVRVVVTPVGAPSTDRSMLAVNPSPRLTVTVAAPLVPCCTVKVLTESARSSVGVPPVGVLSPHAATVVAKAKVTSLRIEVFPQE